ncbi:hypothetical protein FGO68_gene10063 [Halteria grandinella]|uniref:Uncharacterized protein n=1 Tax=Halteria grandinella TaxID=5974 RepID=A0A8J8NQD6_HALGN|nr:hypothetical protein FGO68_gene10063 [Halteria grandinella]
MQDHGNYTYENPIYQGNHHFPSGKRHIPIHQAIESESDHSFVCQTDFDEYMSKNPRQNQLRDSNGRFFSYGNIKKSAKNPNKKQQLAAVATSNQPLKEWVRVCVEVQIENSNERVRLALSVPKTETISKCHNTFQFCRQLETDHKERVPFALDERGQELSSYLVDVKSLPITKLLYLRISGKYINY